MNHNSEELTNEDYTNKYNLIKSKKCTEDNTKPININTCINENKNEEYTFITYSTISDDSNKDSISINIKNLIDNCIHYLSNTYNIKYNEFNEFLKTINLTFNDAFAFTEKYNLISPLSYDYIESIAQSCKLDNKYEDKDVYSFTDFLKNLHSKFEEVSKLTDNHDYLMSMEIYFTEILTLLAKHIYLYLSNKLIDYVDKNADYMHILIMLKNESDKYYYNGHIFGLYYTDSVTKNDTIANNVYISTFQRGRSYCKYIVTYYAEILEKWYPRSGYVILVTNLSEFKGPKGTMHNCYIPSYKSAKYIPHEDEKNSEKYIFD